MRKNCARKWLHFTIDLLPFVVIPVFAIWSINHGNANQTADITYKFETNEIESAADLVEGNIYHLDRLLISDEMSAYFELSLYHIGELTEFTLSNLDEVYISEYYANNGSCILLYSELYTVESDVNTTLYCSNPDGYISYIFEGRFELLDIDFVIDTGFLSDFVSYIEHYVSLYEIEMPTASTYNEILSVDIVDVDVGTAFFNSLYNTTTKYFNFDNVFNFGALKQWFVTNWFGGTMPQIFEIIYNVIVYEFLSDVIMLIYAFFMFIIDFANDLLEKPFSDIKRG